MPCDIALRDDALATFLRQLNNIRPPIQVTIANESSTELLLFSIFSSTGEIMVHLDFTYTENRLPQMATCTIISTIIPHKNEEFNSLCPPRYTYLQNRTPIKET